MIKMDIKGATERAFTGGKRPISRGKRSQLVIWTEESADNAKEIASFIDNLKLGY
jgi:hypothetical protein